MSDLLVHLSNLDYFCMGALSFERFHDTFNKLSPTDEQHVLQACARLYEAGWFVEKVEENCNNLLTRENLLASQYAMLLSCAGVLGRMIGQGSAEEIFFAFLSSLQQANINDLVNTFQV